MMGHNNINKNHNPPHYEDNSNRGGGGGGEEKSRHSKGSGEHDGNSNEHRVLLLRPMDKASISQRLRHTSCVIIYESKKKIMRTISNFGGSTTSNYFYKPSTSYEEPEVVTSIVPVQAPVSSSLTTADMESLEREVENDVVLGNNRFNKRAVEMNIEKDMELSVEAEVERYAVDLVASETLPVVTPTVTAPVTVLPTSPINTATVTTPTPADYQEKESAAEEKARREVEKAAE
jgi:hypothetical protein